MHLTISVSRKGFVPEGVSPAALPPPWQKRYCSPVILADQLLGPQTVNLGSAEHKQAATVPVQTHPCPQSLASKFQALQLQAS